MKFEVKTFQVLVFITITFRTCPIYASKNELIFERLECDRGPKSDMVLEKCMMKYISRRRLKIDIQMNFTKPVNKAYVHTQAFYRYIRYQKFPINLWDDMCGWFTGKRRSFIMDWTLGKLLQYSNINHACPYIGKVYVKVDNISMDTFVFEQFIPSGRYKVEFNLTEGIHADSTPIFMGKLFASVSDHRVDQFR